MNYSMISISILTATTKFFTFIDTNSFQNLSAKQSHTINLLWDILYKPKHQKNQNLYSLIQLDENSTKAGVSMLCKINLAILSPICTRYRLNEWLKRITWITPLKSESIIMLLTSLKWFIVKLERGDILP